jgi:tetratricopeptide (TPR) repeat protein
MYAQAIKLASTGKDICKISDGESRLLLADLWTTIGAVQVDSHLAEQSYSSMASALHLRLSAAQDSLIKPHHAQMANSYMNLGYAATGSGRIPEAIELAEKSIEIRQRDPENTKAQLQMLAMSFHNVGVASWMDGQLTRSEEAYSKAIQIAQDLSQAHKL